ncbi:MAG: polysaccharide biosynthesis protein [Bacillota bacterium]|nr:polysaccharide biosynthesis protein [Bacillota bacterium]
MQTTGKQNFVKGALILVVANALVKIIGAIFKIPLTNLFGKEGMGIFTVAYNIYTALYIISTAGLPVAVSKMVAEANALGRVNEVRKILRVAFSTFTIVGAVASVVMFFGARAFTDIVGNSMAYYAVLAISPALVFTAVVSTIRGYYQGLSDMVPTAVSQVIEALFKLIVGFGLAFLLLRLGFSISVAAAGAIAGVTVGTMFSAVYLMLRHKREKQKIPFRAGSLDTRSSGEILKNLWMVALPVTVGASVLSLTNLIDMIVVMNRLQDIGYSEAAANALYGAYGMAVTLFNLPQTLVLAISVSVIPVIASSFARREFNGAVRTMESSIKITAVLALPAASGLVFLSGPILNLLYFNKPQDAAIAAPLLKILGLAVFFVAMVSLTNSILQAMGRVNVPVFTMLIGGIVKLVTNYTLVGTKEVNIGGAPIGTTLCYAVIALLNFAFIMKGSDRAPNIFGILIRPVHAMAGMSVSIIAIYAFLAPLTGGKLAVMLTIGAGALIYFILLFIVKGMTKEDVLLLPNGEKLVKILKLR